MRYIKKIKKIEVPRFKAGTTVYHPLLGLHDGIVIEPQDDWGVTNHKKVYVRTKCDRVFTFCPHSLSRVDFENTVEEIVL